MKPVTCPDPELDGIDFFIIKIDLGPTWNYEWHGLIRWNKFITLCYGKSFSSQEFRHFATSWRFEIIIIEDLVSEKCTKKGDFHQLHVTLKNTE
jgi:hypothetical protein